MTFRLFLAALSLFSTLVGCTTRPAPSPVSAPTPPPDASGGQLLVVGGALRDSNAAVFDALVTATGDGRLGIVPAASGRPARNAERFREALVRSGLTAEQITILPLAVRDDPTTETIDESTWATNGDLHETAAAIDALSALWFIGGDQARIMQVLTGPDGAFNATHAALIRLLARGGMVGGTSAGAAFQSEVAILGGSSPGALRHGLGAAYTSMRQQEEGPLKTGRGAGLFPVGIIDQHFDRKGRLGRLIVAVMQNEDTSRRWGVGVDEDTALHVDLAAGRATVIGQNSVVLVDGREAQASQAGRAFENVRLSVLTPGDQLSLSDLAITVDESVKSPTVPNPYHEMASPVVNGIFAPYSGRLEDLLGFRLVDNATRDRLAFRFRHPDGNLHQFTFIQDERTRGYWGTPDGSFDRYTAINVRLDVEWISGLSTRH